MTINNELYVLDIFTGTELWRYSASHVSAISNGSSSPAVTSDTVIFPSNTGEILALDALTISLLWNFIFSNRRVNFWNFRINRYRLRSCNS